MNLRVPPVPTQTQGRPPVDWAAFRSCFPTLERIVYLDTARKALLPRWIEAAMRGYMADIYETAGRLAFSMDEIEAARRDLAAFVGADADTVALIKNTSEGLNIIAHALQLGPGDNVVISPLEHENNTLPWQYLLRHGVELRIAEPGPDGTVPPACYEPLIDANTRLVSLAWVAYGTGYRADVPAVAALARRHGARIAVDAIQAVGILDCRVDALDADFVVSGGHKTLLSTTGAGFMHVRPALADDLPPPFAAKHGFAAADRTALMLQPADGARRFEYGNPNFLGIWLQRRSMQELLGIGLPQIEARVRHLTTLLIDALDAAGLTVRTPRDWGRRAGIVSMETRQPAADVVARLAELGIVVSAKDGLLRASVHAYNDEADIARFVAALTRLA